MPQDAITLNKIAKKLNIFLEGSKINKVNIPSPDEIVLNLYSKYGNCKLCICTNAISSRIGLTLLEKKNPQTPSGFCMLLRKHLLNASINQICAIKGERIIKIVFDAKNDFMENVQKQLYCEIMGKYSNAIFCENEVILGTLKTSSFDLEKDRALLPGAKYTLPKSQGKIDIEDKCTVLSLLNNFSGGNLDEFIFNNICGLSIATAKEIVFRFFNKTSFESPISKVNEFYDFIIDFIHNFPENANVVTVLEKLTDYYFCEYVTVKGEKKFFDDITDAETYFFDNKQKQKQFNELKNKLLSAVNSKLKKEQKKLQTIYEKEQLCEDAEKYRRFGELVIANIYKIKRGDKSVTVTDYYNDNAQLQIPLDEQINANANAQKYFKKYTKLKNTLKAIVPQKEQAINECEYLKSVLSEINTAQNVNDLQIILEELTLGGIIKTTEKQIQKNNKKEEKTQCRVFEFNGYRIFAGKNNIQNDKLTAMAKPSDMWLHVKDYHSAHVIIENNKTHIPDDIILLAAEICAFYSDAHSGTKVPVDYTQKKYVKKTPKAKYGSVIYTDFKTLYVIPNSHKNLETNN